MKKENQLRQISQDTDEKTKLLLKFIYLLWEGAHLNTKRKFVLKIECVCYPSPPVPGAQNGMPYGNDPFHRTLKSTFFFLSHPSFDSFLLQSWDFFFFFSDEETEAQKSERS